MRLIIRSSSFLPPTTLSGYENPEEMSDDEDVETILLTTSARVLADRLDVLEIGPNAIEMALREAVEGELEGARR